MQLIVCYVLTAVPAYVFAPALRDMRKLDPARRGYYRLLFLLVWFPLCISSPRRIQRLANNLSWDIPYTVAPGDA
jgi:hypothetical protein